MLLKLVPFKLDLKMKYMCKLFFFSAWRTNFYPFVPGCEVKFELQISSECYID